MSGSGRRRNAVVFGLLLCAVSACGTSTATSTATTGVTISTSSTVPATTVTSSAPSTSASSTAGNVASIAVASTTPVSTPDTAGTTPLASLSVTAQTGADRVTFQFAGTAVPGYSVSYVNRPVLSDPKGEPVTIAGAQVLLVRLAGSSLSDVNGQKVYNGSTRFTPGLGSVQEVVETGDFEAVLHWAIGVRTKAAFAVSALTDPPRLVIDVASPGGLANTP